jgi:hypothetical protein
MARKGASSLIDVVEARIIPRPDPPYELTDEESDSWRAIVASMPADHFMVANFPLLIQLCKHIAASRRVDALIQAATKKRSINVRELALLYRMQDLESKAITSLSRQLRLSPRSLDPTQTIGRKIKGVTASSRELVAAPWHRKRDNETEIADGETETADEDS